MISCLFSEATHVLSNNNFGIILLALQQTSLFSLIRYSIPYCFVCMFSPFSGYLTKPNSTIMLYIVLKRLDFAIASGLRWLSAGKLTR